MVVEPSKRDQFMDQSMDSMQGFYMILHWVSVSWNAISILSPKFHTEDAKLCSTPHSESSSKQQQEAEAEA
jgi:hypothetical protein